MAKIRWIGGAIAVAQVDTVTPANVEIGDIFKITLTDDAGHSYQISYTAAAATVKDVVEGLKALAVAAKSAGYSPWADVTVTEDDAKCTIAADDAGVPFYVATATVDGGGNNTQTLVDANITPNSGPNDAKTAANWSGGALPVAADEVSIDRTADNILYGLDFSAVLLARLLLPASFTGKLGQAEVLGAGYFRVGATIVNIGEQPGSVSLNGSPRIKLDLGADASTIVVYSTSAAAEESDIGLPPVRILCNNAATVLHLKKGKAAVAGEIFSEVSTLASAQQSWTDSQATDTELTLGEGCTIPELTKTGGSAVVNCALTTLTQRGQGTCETRGAGAVGAMAIYGGTVYPNATGQIGAITIDGDGATVDFTRSTQPREVASDIICRLGDVAFDPDVVAGPGSAVLVVRSDEPVKYAATKA